MINFHPPLTAFPIAFICLVTVLELLNISLFKENAGLKFSIKILLVASLFGSIAAFFSGYQASELANQSFQVADEVIQRHHVFGRSLLILNIVLVGIYFIQQSAKFYLKFFKICYYCLLLLNLALVIYTGYLGGQLVFSHGAGVKLNHENSN